MIHQLSYTNALSTTPNIVGQSIIVTSSSAQKHNEASLNYKQVYSNVLVLYLRFLVQFSPELVLVSAGFDAARGDPFGRYGALFSGYSKMTLALCALAGGRVVMALEGGYNLESISERFGACVAMLLGDPAPPPPEDPIPNDRYNLVLLSMLIVLI